MVKTTHTDRRRKLSAGDRLDIHHRYYERLRTGEKVCEIATDYGIARQYVLKVAREVEKGKAPSSDQLRGSDDTAASQAYPNGRAA